MKLAWRCETCARPTVKPLRPHDSMSRAALSSGGLRKTLPHESISRGWVSLRRSSTPSIVRFTSASSPGLRRSVASSTISRGGMSLPR